MGISFFFLEKYEYKHRLSRKTAPEWKKMVNFQDAYTSLFKRFLCFVLNIMHDWGAVDFRICMAPKNHGYLISAQSYEFCPHLAQLDNLDFTLSPIYL